LVELIALVAAALTLIAGGIWLIGACERAYAIAADPAWFVAWRGESAPKLAPGVRIKWQSHSDFALIGAADAYWSRFMILAGEDNSVSPIDVSGAEDAFVARVNLIAPPRLALGILRTLITLGVLSKPSGEIARDAQSLGFREELMPSTQAIATLLAQPQTYAPSMVNFLGYYARAKGAAGSGAAAYRRYGMVAMRTVYRTGGALLFYGRVESVLHKAKAGPTLGPWDEVAAMRYPNPAAILSMEHVPEYRAALRHRDAGLERTVVIASS
jgi:uncharacterized protein (DUF1330 family)